MATAIETNGLAAQLETLKKSADQAIRNESADQFEDVERQINAFDATVREWQQELWIGEAQAAISRLERNEPLGPEDERVIRAFLVGDAEHYLSQENNFGDWIGELRRLFSDIGGRLKNVNRNSIAELRGVIKDAIRLVPDIRNYLEEQSRVERFQSGMKSLDRPTRETMARLLREQLQSPKR